MAQTAGQSDTAVRSIEITEGIEQVTTGGVGTEIKSEPPPQATDEVPKETSKAVSRSLLIVYLTAFLDTLGVTIVQPILPFYTDEFGASAFQLGLLYTSSYVMILIFTFISGKMSDRYGRKPMIIASLFGSAAGSLCSGLSRNYTELLISRFIGGLFAGTLPVAEVRQSSRISRLSKLIKFVSFRWP